jgi:hypothetical protein
MQSFSSVDMANADVQKVAQGMMAVVDSLANFTKAEKYGIISSVFNCMYNNKLKQSKTVGDTMEVVDQMRYECKRMKIPEFGGAERYVIGEL